MYSNFYIKNKNIRKHKRCIPCLECISKKLNTCKIENNNEEIKDNSKMIIDNNI